MTPINAPTGARPQSGAVFHGARAMKPADWFVADRGSAGASALATSDDLYTFVWRVSGRQQLLLCGLTGLVIPLAMVPLELQRRIIDEALVNHDLSLLLALAGTYLSVLLLQQSLKYALNLTRGWIVECVTRRLRAAIYRSVHRPVPDPSVPAPANPAPAGTSLPITPGAAVPMIAAESEDVGGFVGDSLSLPLQQGGTIVAVLAYLVWVDWRIAGLAVAIYLPQFLTVRRVQAGINRLARGYAKLVRRLGQVMVAEDGPRFAHLFGNLTDRAYGLRMQIYRRKFALTFLGNFLDALGPLLVLAVGGWFVMRGETAVSTLIVFITGLQKIADPWNQLINFYRTLQIALTKYRLLVQTLG